MAMIRAIVQVLAEEDTIDSELLFVRGRLTCERTCVFWEKVAQNSIGMGIVVDDARTIQEFMLIRLNEQWILRGPEDEPMIPKPILSYTQRESLLLLEGLHWHVFSDVFFVHRSFEWYRQVLQVAELVIYRLICIGMSSSDVVLDYTEYRTLTPCRVNFAFLFDVECYIRELLTILKDDEPCVRNKLENVQVAQNDQLIKTMVASVDKVREDEIVRLRRIYYEDLVVSEGMRRIFRRTHQYNLKPVSREILVNKLGINYGVHCKTKADVLFPRLQDEQILQVISFDSVFLMYCRSVKTGSPIEVLIQKPGFPRIRYVRTLACWVVEATEDSPLVYCISMLSAFVVFRTRHTDIREKHTTKLDIFDHLLT